MCHQRLEFPPCRGEVHKEKRFLRPIQKTVTGLVSMNGRLQEEHLEVILQNTMP